MTRKNSEESSGRTYEEDRSQLKLTLVMLLDEIAIEEEHGTPDRVIESDLIAPVAVVALAATAMLEKFQQVIEVQEQ